MPLPGGHNCSAQETTWQGRPPGVASQVTVVASDTQFSVDSSNRSGVSLNADLVQAHSVPVYAADLVVSLCVCGAPPFQFD